MSLNTIMVNSHAGLSTGGRGLCLRGGGVCLQGGGLPTEGRWSAYRGRGLSPTEGGWAEPPPTSEPEKRAVCILLECFLVTLIFGDFGRTSVLFDIEKSSRMFTEIPDRPL